MTLVGRNEDSSGFYEIHRDGDQLVTLTGSSPEQLHELGRQQLYPVPADAVDQGDENWYRYGVDGHQCDINAWDMFARIDAITYELH